MFLKTSQLTHSCLETCKILHWHHTYPQPLQSSSQSATSIRSRSTNQRCANDHLPPALAHYGRAVRCVEPQLNFYRFSVLFNLFIFHHVGGHEADELAQTLSTFFQGYTAGCSQFVSHAAGSLRLPTERQSGERRRTAAGLRAEPRSVL